MSHMEAWEKNTTRCVVQHYDEGDGRTWTYPAAFDVWLTLLARPYQPLQHPSYMTCLYGEKYKNEEK
jgi:hypothetical protein